MNKLWIVARYEYTRHVLRRRFIFALLGLPLMIGLMALIVLVLLGTQDNSTPLGYVDASGLLTDAIQSSDHEDDGIPIIAFAAPADARTALESDEIQAYYVLPVDYLQTQNVELFFLKEPPGRLQRQFRDFLRVNLLKDQPANVARIVQQGPDWTIHSLDGRRQFSGAAGAINILTPILAGTAFLVAVFTGAGYLFQAILEEKENRTIEILVTSLSPGKLIAGKIVGLVAVALTPIAAWITTTFVVLLIATDENGIALIQHVPFEPILIISIVMLPVFVLFGGLMVTIGTTVADVREGAPLTGLFTLLATVPLYVLVPILGSPDSPLSLALSFFPFTAPLTLAMRLAVSTVPLGQIALILVVQVIAALGAVWLAGRAFRLGMLRYGQRLPWRMIFGRMRRSSVSE